MNGLTVAYCYDATPMGRPETEEAKVRRKCGLPGLPQLYLLAVVLWDKFAAKMVL
jgi:hypothetical protein